MQWFFAKLSLQDTYSKHNYIRVEELDKTYMKGSKPIDSIAVTEGISECIEGSSLLYHNEILLLDHRSYAVDFNAEDYFDDNISE